MTIRQSTIMHRLIYINSVFNASKLLPKSIKRKCLDTLDIENHCKDYRQS
jgi:hypothetical protein